MVLWLDNPLISSNIDIFTQNKHEYEVVLKNGGYKGKLVYRWVTQVVTSSHVFSPGSIPPWRG